MSNFLSVNKKVSNKIRYVIYNINQQDVFRFRFAQVTNILIFKQKREHPIRHSLLSNYNSINNSFATFFLGEGFTLLATFIIETILHPPSRF